MFTNSDGVFRLECLKMALSLEIEQLKKGHGNIFEGAPSKAQIRVTYIVDHGVGGFHTILGLGFSQISCDSTDRLRF